VIAPACQVAIWKEKTTLATMVIAEISTSVRRKSAVFR
jgi:hypothetical protein